MVGLPHPGERDRDESRIFKRFPFNPVDCRMRADIAHVLSGISAHRVTSRTRWNDASETHVICVKGARTLVISHIAKRGCVQINMHHTLSPTVDPFLAICKLTIL